MGRHSQAEEPPPPKNKPRYRFLVAICGILMLAFTTMAIVAAIFPDKGPQAAATPEDPDGGDPFPVVTGQPDPSGSVPSVTDGQPPAPGTQPTDAPNGQITGSYVLAGAAWQDGFIGSVQLTNTEAQPQPWQVVLVFPSTVGDLQNRWIAGGPGGSTVTRNGQTVVFNSTQPLGAGERIGLNFQFAKTGNDFGPRECWVNGRACS